MRYFSRNLTFKYFVIVSTQLSLVEVRASQCNRKIQNSCKKGSEKYQIIRTKNSENPKIFWKNIMRPLIIIFLHII